MVSAIPIMISYDKKYIRLKDRITNVNIKIDESHKNKEVKEISSSETFKTLYSGISKKGK